MYVNVVYFWPIFAENRDTRDNCGYEYKCMNVVALVHVITYAPGTDVSQVMVG